MQVESSHRKVVIVNQAINYLTIDICNAFAKQCRDVELITGSVHAQGDNLKEEITITRINQWVQRPASKKLYSYLIACWKIYWLLLFKFRKHEVLFISIPPMAYLLMIGLPNRFSILIWDVYPDVFKITGMKEKNPIYWTWVKLNKILFERAYRLFTVGNKMAGLLEKYISREKLSIIPLWAVFTTNGKVKKEENPFIKKHGLKDKFIVQYSGNIGLTHNVEVMVELAELMKEEPKILFQIIGRGPRMPYLKNLVQQKKLPNCSFLPYQTDEMFPYSLSAADLGVVILDEATAQGSVPSKSYNIMSFGIPSLYIAGKNSELYDYTIKYRHGKCFASSNIEAAADFITSLFNSRESYDAYSENALKAVQNFKKTNADTLVSLYLQEDKLNAVQNKK